MATFMSKVKAWYLMWKICNSICSGKAHTLARLVVVIQAEPAVKTYDQGKGENVF